MTQQEIIESNKLIAEFMGGRFKKASKEMGVPDRFFDLKDKGYYYSVDELKYHSSWDWLMQVIEKIESIDEDLPESPRNYHFFIQKRRTRVVYDWATYLSDEALVSEKLASFKDYSHNSKIERTYIAVVEFIKYCNKNEHDRTGN